MNTRNIMIYLYKQISKVLFSCENQGVTLEPRNPVGPRRILVELSRSSYEEGSR
jgi:hypothetical protein